MTPLPLQDRVALITGATGDLGAAIAARFLEAGARLALIDVDAAQLKARCAREFGASDRILLMACDVADPDQTRTAVDETARHFGALSILVNNAATESTRTPVADVSLAEWRRTLEVNLTGAWLMAKWAIPHLRRAGGGVILNIASQLGHVATPGSSAYSASKAALLSLTRSIAVDCAADRIRAVSLSPGAVMTSRLTRRYGTEDEVNRALAGKHPVGRIGRPRELAEAALYLVSDGASFVTGSDLLADGGYTAV